MIQATATPHAVLIVGYEEPTSVSFNVIFNDPYPYDQAGGVLNNIWNQLASGSRSLLANQYSVDLDKFMAYYIDAIVNVHTSQYPYELQDLTANHPDTDFPVNVTYVAGTTYDSQWAHLLADLIDGVNTRSLANMAGAKIPQNFNGTVYKAADSPTGFSDCLVSESTVLNGDTKWSFNCDITLQTQSETVTSFQALLGTISASLPPGYILEQSSGISDAAYVSGYNIKIFHGDDNGDGKPFIQVNAEVEH